VDGVLVLLDESPFERLGPLRMIVARKKLDGSQAVQLALYGDDKP
jgi:hypothetical protein